MLELSPEAAILVDAMRRQAGARKKALMRIVPGRGRGLQRLNVDFVDDAMLGEAVNRSNGITVCMPRGLARALDGKRLEVIHTDEGDRLFLDLGANGARPTPVPVPPGRRTPRSARVSLGRATKVDDSVPVPS